MVMFNGDDVFPDGLFQVQGQERDFLISNTELQNTEEPMATATTRGKPVSTSTKD